MAHKYALLVACTYPDTPMELKGCIHDANSMQEVLIKRFGFEESNIEMLNDKPGSENKPTASNIKAVLNQFFSGAKSGDVVFLFYAGNGTVIPATSSSSGKVEQAIVPCDFNLITSIDFRKVLHGAPEGVTFVFVSDSCHSGGLIDKAKEQIGPDHPPTKETVSADDHSRPRTVKFEVILQQLSLLTPIVDDVNYATYVHAQFEKLFGSETCLALSTTYASSSLSLDKTNKPDHGILLSGCQPDELSIEKMFDGIVHGAFSWALLTVLKKHPGPITNRDLVLGARQFLEIEKFEDQHPCLYCSNDNFRAFFLLQKF